MYDPRMHRSLFDLIGRRSRFLVVILLALETTAMADPPPRIAAEQASHWLLGGVSTAGHFGTISKSGSELSLIALGIQLGKMTDFEGAWLLDAHLGGFRLADEDGLAWLVTGAYRRWVMNRLWLQGNVGLGAATGENKDQHNQDGSTTDHPREGFVLGAVIGCDVILERAWSLSVVLEGFATIGGPFFSHGWRGAGLQVTWY